MAQARYLRGDVDPGEHADVDQVDVVAAADGIGASQLLDARTALAGALTSGVLQAGHQRSALPGRARLPGAAAGGGRQLVRRVLRSGQGRACVRPWRRRSAGTAM